MIYPPPHTRSKKYLIYESSYDRVSGRGGCSRVSSPNERKIYASRALEMSNGTNPSSNVHFLSFHSFFLPRSSDFPSSEIRGAFVRRACSSHEREESIWKRNEVRLRHTISFVFIWIRIRILPDSRTMRLHDTVRINATRCYTL